MGKDYELAVVLPLCGNDRGFSWVLKGFWTGWATDAGFLSPEIDSN